MKAKWQLIVHDWNFYESLDNKLFHLIIRRQCWQTEALHYLHCFHCCCSKLPH